MRVTGAILALSVLSGSATAAPPPGLDLRGLPPLFAHYLLTHPDEARHIAELRAHAGTAKSGPPKLISGKITTATVDVMTAPAAPAVAIKYSAPAGLGLAIFLFLPPAGIGEYEIASDISSPNDKSGTLTFQDAAHSIGLYADPGNWTLSEAVLVDQAGNTALYTATQLTALFPSVTFALTNAGTPDVTPPTFSTGKILTPTVDLGGKAPYFGVNLKVADNLSGVENVTVFVEDPTSAEYEAFGTLTAPVLSGTGGAYLAFNPGQNYNAGTWSIVGIEVSDVAGNIVQDMSEADIKAVFGKATFTVTN